MKELVKKANVTGGDGVNVSIWKNGSMVWPVNGGWQTIGYNDAIGVSHDFTLSLAQEIHFPSGWINAPIQPMIPPSGTR